MLKHTLIILSLTLTMVLVLEPVQTVHGIMMSHAEMMALEAADAVTAWRGTIGATDPAEAAEGTIRRRFAESKGRNAVHGSDSDENAVREIAFFFPERELALLGVNPSA